jgi:hypothetical protein
MISEDTHVHYTFHASLVRLIQGHLLPSFFTVKAEIEFMEPAYVPLALQKIEYWLDNFMSRAVAFCASDETAYAMFLDDKKAPRLQNYLMITPDDPTDEHIAMILQAKLQALSGGAMAVGMIELSSDDSAGFTFTYLGDGEDELPLMDEWIEGPNWFKEPWWCRDDASMIDTIAPDGADLTQIPAWAVNLDFLANEVVQPEAVIIKADFEPKIVDPESLT